VPSLLSLSLFPMVPASEGGCIGGQPPTGGARRPNPDEGRPLSARHRSDRSPIGRTDTETAGLCQLPPIEAGLGAAIAWRRTEDGPTEAEPTVVGPREC
jgi:hypothetical protein